MEDLQGYELFGEIAHKIQRFFFKINVDIINVIRELLKVFLCYVSQML